MTEMNSSFWTFSLQIYAKPGLAETCLELQDHCGADVNLLLFMLWSAYEHRRLSVQDIEKVSDLVKPWQEGVVRPLRLARRTLKSAAEGWQFDETAALRQRIKAEELNAERIQQDVMETFFRANDLGQPDRVPEAVTANLEGYATAIHAAFPEKHVSILVRSISEKT